MRLTPGDKDFSVLSSVFGTKIPNSQDILKK